MRRETDFLYLFSVIILLFCFISIASFQMDYWNHIKSVYSLLYSYVIRNIFTIFEISQSLKYLLSVSLFNEPNPESDHQPHIFLCFILLFIIFFDDIMFCRYSSFKTVDSFVAARLNAVLPKDQTVY